MSIQIKFGSYDFADAPVDNWDTDIDTKLQKYDRALADGADYKDIYLGIRTVSIKGTICGATAEDTRIILNGLLSALNKGKQYLTLFNDRRIYAIASKPQHNYQAGLTFVEYSITFLCGSPYWEKVALTEPAEVTIDSSPKEFVINNPGPENAFPLITITADKAITDLILQNETDIPEGETEGLKFEYEDPAFFNAGIVVVDCREGTVYRGTTNTIRYFTGAFLKLLPGNNTIKYTGDTNGATKVKLSFYERFL